MTTNVVTVDPSMTIRATMEILIKHKISGAPVVDTQGTVVTVVSEGSLLKLAARFGLAMTITQCLPSLTRADRLVSVKRSDTFQEVYRIFLAKAVHRILVIDDRGKLQGLVSRSNVIRFILESGKAPAADVPVEAKKDEQVKTGKPDDAFDAVNRAKVAKETKGA